MFGLLLSLSSWCQPAYSASFSSSVFTNCVPYQELIQVAVKRWWPDLPYWKLWQAQLIAESRCQVDAVSGVGAAGIAQFMPQVAKEWARRLDYDPMTSPHDAKFAIPAGAAFMASLRAQWHRNRDPIDQHWLAAASYNRGIGNIVKDQTECQGAKLWPDIAKCTGRHTMETLQYVKRIEDYWRAVEIGVPSPAL